jgi:predicted nucleic acid-binding protein
MSYLFDTNVVSELRVLRRAHPSFRAWALAVDVATVFISAITLLELERGVFAAERRKQPHAPILRDWMTDHVLPTYRERILPIHAEIALACARMPPRNPDHDADLLIAATAIVNDLTLVTRNVADFAGTGVRLLNPWSA